MQHAEVTSLFPYPTFLFCVSIAGVEATSIKNTNRKSWEVSLYLKKEITSAARGPVKDQPQAA